MSANLVEDYEKRINSVINFIETGISKPIQLRDLAYAANFSPYHFHRIFKAFTGETPKNFIWRIRLEKAANSLKFATNKTITEIALEFGFDSSSSFSKKFKAHFGITPKEFKLRSDDLKPEIHKPAQYPLPDPLPEITIQYYEQIEVLYAANRKGYNDQEIGKAWGELVKYAQKYNLFRKNTRFFGISFDNPEFTDPDKCRYYACITNPGVGLPDNELGKYSIGAGKYASFDFFDTADKISIYYDFIYREWFPGEGWYPANKPAFDIYLNDPDNDPEGRLKMTINIPVESKE